MVKNKACIVIGLGYGDEGKGLTTDFLSLHNKNPLVIRFNGGHQAGHCVVTKSGEKHVFSNLGSGTFRNIPTFWSSYCTFCPTFFIEELSQLKFKTKFFIDYNSPITTHYEILFNRASETSLGKKRKGSCGLGFGATIDRERNKKSSFVFRDLLDEKTISKKLSELRKYYKQLVNIQTAFNFDSFNHSIEDQVFIKSIREIRKLIDSNIVIPITEHDVFKQYHWDSLIFEGAQGILLDENFGQFPHITKSNTTSKNALEIISRLGLNLDIEIFYVTRAYQTKHGAGPFPKTHPSFNLINNEGETNLTNQYQGKLKLNYLNIDDLKKSIQYDKTFSLNYSKNLIITCLDHFPNDEIKVFMNKNLIQKNYTEIPDLLDTEFSNVYFSFNSCGEYIEEQNN